MIGLKDFCTHWLVERLIVAMEMEVLAQTRPVGQGQEFLGGNSGRSEELVEGMPVHGKKLVEPLSACLPTLE